MKEREMDEDRRKIDMKNRGEENRVFQTYQSVTHKQNCPNIYCKPWIQGS
jgi:hypothetical protein